MQKYVMTTTDKTKFILSEEEKEAVFKAVLNGKQKQIVVQGQMIPINIAPTIITMERWWSQENERLALTHHRLCKNCLSIMHIQDKCPCWKTMGKGELKSGIEAPLLPQGVADTIQQLADKKAFPQLDRFDRAKLEDEEKQARLANANRAISTQEGAYIDPETGETFYS